MNDLSVPTVVMAGVTFYTGFYHLMVYVRRRQQRQDLTFALTCLAVGFYDVFSAGLYNVETVSEGVQWQRAQVVTLAIVAIFFAWFIYDYTTQATHYDREIEERKNDRLSTVQAKLASQKKWLYLFSAFFILAAIIEAVDRSSLTWMVNNPSIKHVSLPFGLAITYYEATPGLMTNIQSTMGLLLGVYVLWSGIILFQSEQKNRARFLFAATVVFFAGVANDTAVSSGIYTFIYTIEYAYMGIVLLMVYSLSGEVLEAATVKGALRESEQKFRSIVEASPMGIHMFSLEPDGRLVLTGANSAADTILGVDHSQFIGKTIEEVFPNLANTDIPDRYRQVCIRDEPWYSEHVDVADNQIRGALEVYAFRTNPGKMGVLFLEISERKRAEAALRKERDLVSRVMETSPAGIVMVDRDGQIIFANSQAEQVLGISRAEIGQRTYNTPEWHITDYSGKPFPEDQLPFHRVMSTGEPVFGVRHAIEWPGGQRVLLSINAAPLRGVGDYLDGMVSTVEDISAQVQAENTLRESAERLKTLREIDQAILAAQSPEAIAEAVLSNIQHLVPCVRASVSTINFEKRQVRLLAVQAKGATSVGKGMQGTLEEFGFDQSLLQGQLTVTEDLQNIVQLSPVCQKLLAEGVHSILNVPLLVQGELIGSLNLGFNQPGPSSVEQMEVAGELADVLAVAIQQARLHEQVKQHTEELEERVRQRTAELEAKNRELETFTYSVSHDLKAPLRGIDGYSRLLQDDYMDRMDDEGRTFISMIRNGVARMNQLIDDLLSYSRLERRSLTIDQVYLPAFLASIVAERSSEIQSRGLQLVQNIPPIYLMTESEGLSQALRNLLDNSLKFTRETAKPVIEIGAQDGERSCILWVKDNGIGFDMQYHDRIFEIFQHLQRAEDYPGTGIGLALVRKVMQRIGGRVWAESVPGAGATFYLEIPK
jgi:PAS domain S-box-containing protein